MAAEIRTLFWIFLLLTLCCGNGLCTSLQAKQILKMAAGFLYKAPAGNGFIRSIETNKFNQAQYNNVIARLGRLATSSCPISRRQLPEHNFDYISPQDDHMDRQTVSTIDLDALRQEILNYIDTSEGKMEAIGNLMRDVDGLEIQSFIHRRALTQTWNLYIPSGKLGGKTKAAVLLARVKNVMSNKLSFKLLTNALKNGTARAALVKMSSCKGLVQYNRFISG